MRPARRVHYVDIINMLNGIDSDLSELSDLPNSDDEGEDWTPPKVRNKSDDAELLSESVDKEDAVPNGTVVPGQRCVD
ncbi:hypothetical protein QYM36_012790 [Artemia franciscana]|uniref:Uncharacterized protein n=1 Tax=Artemia franciscana TaxID=6661 RepID=A0AA88HLT0_ARTSF|nr:hypothetical protein QYM36_012790 [Artemia franciscana]